MPSNKTSVIIPNLIVSEELLGLMQSTVKHFREGTPSEVELEIILIDDGSTLPGAAEWMKENADIFIQNEHNLGFAKTCNRGFHAATGYYIVCANNDIEVYPGWWQAMTEPFVKEATDVKFKHVGVTGLISYTGRLPEGVPIKDWKIKKITEGGLLNGWMQSGGLWMTTRPVMDECGMFDEQFERGGYEDIDLFMRYQHKFGKKLIMSGMSAFWHKEGATRWNCEVDPNYKKESKRIEESNRVKFTNKWGWDYYSSSPWKEREIWRG